MPFVANGSRICDTNRNPLAGMDVSHTLADNTSVVIIAAGMAVTGGDEAKGGNPHTWQFSQLGGVFANITTVSEVRFADSVALVHNTLLSSANRRAVLGANFVQSGREFETGNDLTQSTLKNSDEAETQVAVTFEFAALNQVYEFQVLWEEKSLGPTPSSVQAFVTSAGAQQALFDAALTASGSVAVELSVASLLDAVLPLENVTTASVLFTPALLDSISTGACVISPPELFLPGAAAIPGTDSVTNSTRYATRGASHIWWNFDKQRWDGLMPQVSDFFIMKDIRSATPTFTTVSFSTANASILDVIYDPGVRTVYGLVSHAVSGDMSVATYNPVTDIYTKVVNGVPASVGYTDRKAPGVIHKTPNGFLWTAIHTASGVIIDQSVDNGATWLTTPFNLVNTGDWGRVDLSHYSFGGNTFLIILIMEQEASASAEQRCFIINETSSSTLFGSYFEEVLPAYQGTEESYQSAALARGADNSVYGVVQTGAAAGATDAGIILYKRTAAGVWSRHVATVKSDGFINPSVTLDEINGHVYIVCVNGAGQGFYCRAPLSTMAFEVPVLLFTGVNAFEEIEVPNHNVDGVSGLEVVIRDSVVRNMWQTNVPLNLPVTDIFLDAALTASSVVNAAIFTPILMNAVIADSGDITAGLLTAITATSLITSNAQVIASGLSVDILMSAIINSSETVAANLLTDIIMSAGLTASGLIISPLFTEIILSSTMTGTVVTTTNISTSINMGANVTFQVNTSSQLFTIITMSSVMLASADITADFIVSANIFFDTIIDSSVNILPDITTSILLEVGIGIFYNNFSALASEITFISTMSGSGVISNPIFTTSITLASIIQGTGILGSTLITEVNLQTLLSGSVNVLGTFTTDIALISILLGTNQVTTDLSIEVNTFLDSIITGGSQVQGELLTTINILANLTGESDFTGNLTLDIFLDSNVKGSSVILSDLLTELRLGSVITTSGDVVSDILTSINMSSTMFSQLNIFSNMFIIGATITTIDNRKATFNKSDIRKAAFNKGDIRKATFNSIDIRGGIF